MSDNKKYYYMKVKEDFFDSEEMKILETMDNGVAYQNLYLKICLLSVKSEGALLFKGVIPYDIKMLSVVLRVPIDTVKTGIEIFLKLGLIEILDGGTIYLSDIQSMIGKSSSEADRKRKYRSMLNEKKEVEGVGHLSSKCPLEIEKEIDIEIELNNTQTSVCEEEKPKKKTPNKDVLDFYFKTYNKIFGHDYVYTGNYFPRVNKFLSSKLKDYSVEQLCKAIEVASTEDFAIKDLGFEITSILSVNMLTKYLNPDYKPRTSKQTERASSYDWDKV